MQDIEIRTCRTDDLAAVRDLMSQLSEFAQTKDSFALSLLQQLHDEMAQYPGIYLNLVAVSKGEVVGFLSLIFYRTFFHKGGTALINELVVSREMRGKGIGGALLQKAREEAVQRGMDEVEVGTERTNVQALRFYGRHGFDEEYVLLGMEL